MAAQLKTELTLRDKNFSAQLNSACRKAQASLAQVSNTTKGFGNILGGLGGQLGKTVSGLSGMAGAFTSLVNPVTAVGAAVGLAGKAFFDYNKRLEETQRLTREFTGLDGNQLSSLTNGIQAVADSTGHEFKEVLSSVDAMMAQFGIHGETALKIIQDGFVAGADEQGRFLEMLGQYQASFNDIGVSADELTAIIAQTRSGIFNEEGMTAIQMAGKNIRNMSNSTKESLAAIGVNADQMIAKLRSGSMTTMQAIQQISGALKNVPAQAQETGAVLQDVFGKKGAKAGYELVTSLADMSTNLDEVKSKTGEHGQAIDELINTTREWNNACESLFGASGAGFEDMGKKMKTYVLQNLTKIINKFIDLYNKSTLIRGAIAAVAANFKNAWAVIKAIFRQLGIAITGIADAFEHLVTGDWGKIGGDIDKTLAATAANIGNLGKEAADNFAGAFNQALHGHIDKVTTEDVVESDYGKSTGKGTGGGKSTGKGSGGKSTKTTPKTSKPEKVEEPKFAKDSLDDLKDQLQKLKESYTKGFYTKGKEQYLKEVKELEDKIENKEIELGIKIAPTKLEKLEKQLKELEDNQLNPELALDPTEYKRQHKELETEIKSYRIEQGIDLDVDEIEKEYKETIDNFGKKSSFEIAIGFQEPTTDSDRLSYIQNQMDAYDGLLDYLQQQKEKLEELGQTGTEVYQQITDKINQTKEAQAQLSGEASTTNANIKKSTKFQENFNNAADAVSNLGDAFSTLGSSFETPELNIAGTIAQAIAQIALGFAQASSKEAKTGVWGWIAASVAGLATMAAMISQIHSLSGYASGGIIGGGKPVGDKNLVRVNSGELILNQSQQGRLWRMINGNTSIDNGQQTNSQVEFKIRGADLYGSLKNYKTLAKK